MPSARVRELERLLGTIRRHGSTLLNYDMWDHYGRSSATDEQCAQWDADASAASKGVAEARAQLEALVTAIRAEAPAEIAAWADAHDAYLAEFLAESKSDDTGAFVANQERTAWAEVRAGTRAFVDEDGYYVTMNPERYRRLFGIDPGTLDDI